MDLLRNVPSWDEVERTLDQKFNELNQSVNSGFQSANDSWNGFTRRASSAATTAYGYAGGNRIDSVRLAMAKSYPIIQTNLTRKWASIEIEKILPVLMQLIREVVMIVGGSVAIGTLAGGIAGSMAFGAGAAPGAIIGSGIGLQVGNLILMALGLAAIGEYFYNGLMPCLTTLYEGITTAWNAEEGLKHSGLDPTGGSAALKDERIERAARQMASGQEQLVLLLFTAIVTYLTRGQVKAGVLNSMESIATRSASLRAGMPNKELAAWLGRNEQKLLANPELRVKEPAPLANTELRVNEPAPLAETELTPAKSKAADSTAPQFLGKRRPKFKDGFTEDDILKIPKGERPLPETYLEKSYIEEHLKAFEDGGSFLFTSADIKNPKYPAFNPNKFVMAKADLAEKVSEFQRSGDVSVLEKALGYEPGALIGKDVYVLNLEKTKVLMPSGNEGGVNELWRPGGLTHPGGMREAVLDNISIPHGNSIDTIMSSYNAVRIQ